MRIIISHVHTDFDALASMFAAKKLYPDAHIVITDKQNIPVRQFLNIYRDTLPLLQDHLVDWGAVTEIILVDVASLSRAGDYARKINEDRIKITVYDHHPPHEKDVQKDAGVIEPVGAAVTLLLEEIQQKEIEINPFEATLFGLGIYTDTGSFAFNNTTGRDFQAAGYLMEQGMNLEMIHRFSAEILLPEQQEIINHLFQQSSTYHIEGLDIVVSSYEQDTFQKGLATITQKLLGITDADAVIAVVRMKKRVYVVGRASSERINLLPLLQKWKGGGHPQAGSATIKDGEQLVILDEVIAALPTMIQPAITARDMMASPVKTIGPDTSIEEAGQLMYRYGHSGFPVVKDEQLLGMVTRRDLEKANHHGLGHAPVKAYMTTNVISIPPETTEEEIQRIIIERDIGRLPVVEDEKLIGIVSRTNVIQVLHNHVKNHVQEKQKSLNHLQRRMKQQLPTEIYTLLTNIRDVAQQLNVSAYLIGGIVRDIMLGRPNDDIDIVIEGDGVDFAKQLTSTHGGDVVVHESFGTASWTTTSGIEIDITSSRLEFYERPAALPDVETSTLQEDLYRRDFTINAMALSLHPDNFGELIDPFRGQEDLQEKHIKTLHNLSFIEDPTRILRGVRFETRFGFTMDTQTEHLALESMERMKDVSKHRIVEEMKRIFREDHSDHSMKRLYQLQFWNQFKVSEHTMKESCAHLKALQELYQEEKINNWFSYFVIPFFHEGNLEKAYSFALTKRHAKYLHELDNIRHLHGVEERKSLGELHRMYKDFSTHALLFFAALEKEGSSKTLQYVCQRDALPNYISGQDLLARGLKPSAFFSEILLDVDVAVLDGKIASKKAAESWLENRLCK